MGQSNTTPVRRRCIALVGPYQSGKTSLLEEILARTDTVKRSGAASSGFEFVDTSPEAKNRGMSVEPNIASVSFLGDEFTFIDCPGSIEFQYDTTAVVTGCDAAVVICEADEKKIPSLQVLLKQLEDRNIPHFIFLNKVDETHGRIRDVLNLLQTASEKPLVLRQIPIWDDGSVTGFVDLALERAFMYRRHEESKLTELPDDVRERKLEARFSMLEQLADHDDELMEQLLEDIDPPRNQVFDDLTEDLQQSLICPVLLGSASKGYGILRLLKALRHEAPLVEETAKRLDMPDRGSCAQVLKTYHTSHAGKLSIARILSGKYLDNSLVYSNKQEHKISGILGYDGTKTKKISEAHCGATVAFGKLDNVGTGQTLHLEPSHVDFHISVPHPPDPVYGVAVTAKERRDEVKLTSALHKLVDEDPSLYLEHKQDLAEMVLCGQGDIHLKVALERLVGKYGVRADIYKRTIPYKETIRKSVEVRGKHKKQSGGHGQFGDVLIHIAPLPRDAGFSFTETITGGVVPRQYIPSVEVGVKDYLDVGPLGFPVVDVSVTLIDGSYHNVDSSDQAFRTAGRLAMSKGMPQCAPVLLEPIMKVDVSIPSDATTKINGIISSRRGQILEFNTKEDWSGWERVVAFIPEAELQDLIVDLRSVTAGVGTYTAKYDHLAEITGKLADQIVSEHQANAA